MADMVRKHFILPRHIADEFERVAGARQQSDKLAEIISQWLKNRALLEAVDRWAGSVSAEDHPEWATPEDVNTWVRDLRANQWERNEVFVLREERDAAEDE